MREELGILSSIAHRLSLHLSSNYGASMLFFSFPSTGSVLSDRSRCDVCVPGYSHEGLVFAFGRPWDVVGLDGDMIILPGAWADRRIHVRK